MRPFSLSIVICVAISGCATGICCDHPTPCAEELPAEVAHGLAQGLFAEHCSVADRVRV